MQLHDMGRYATAGCARGTAAEVFQTAHHFHTATCGEKRSRYGSKVIVQLAAVDATAPALNFTLI
jgi:hypothetical protein